MDVIALDLGFGWTKARSSSRSVSFPSVTGAGRRLLDSLAAMANPLDHIEVEVDGRHYFVGALALQQSDLRFFSLAEVKAEAETSHVLALAALGLVADGPVRVVSGLPMGWFFDQRDEFQRFLLGEHLVRVAAGRGGLRERRVVVEAVRLVPQPMGSYLSRIVAEDGRFDPSAASEAVGVIDVGFQTLDLFAAARMQPVHPLCRSTKSGLVMGYRWLADALQERFGLTRAIYEVDDVVRQGYVMHRGRRVDIGDLLETAREYLAQLIQADVETAWAGHRLDRVLVTGGGAYHVGDRLRFGGPAVEILPNPAEANVEGYWRLGRRDQTWVRGAATA